MSPGVAEAKRGALNVLLLEEPEARIGDSSSFRVGGTRFPQGEYLIIAQDGKIQFESQSFGKAVYVTPDSPLFYLTVNGKPYRGSLLIKASGDELRIINQVSLEEYLYGVVPDEMPGTDLEALKAQAIASRTLALQSLEHGKLMRSTITQQAYAGVTKEREIANQAVDETRGKILTYQGNPIASPLFSSTCGGKTEDSQEVFGKALPYLKSVADSDEQTHLSYCEHSPYFSWSVTWRTRDLEAKLSQFGVKGEIEDLIASEVDPNGRVKELVVKTSQRSWSFRGFTIRQVLAAPDGKPLYSTWFALSKSIENGELEFTAVGRGKGHGVGLCQWGAIGMARSGKSFREILEHYYHGIHIEDDSRF